MGQSMGQGHAPEGNVVELQGVARRHVRAPNGARAAAVRGGPLTAQVEASRAARKVLTCAWTTVLTLRGISATHGANNRDVMGCTPLKDKAVTFRASRHGQSQLAKFVDRSTSTPHWYMTKFGCGPSLVIRMSK